MALGSDDFRCENCNTTRNYIYTKGEEPEVCELCSHNALTKLFPQTSRYIFKCDNSNGQSPRRFRGYPLPGEKS